jgi:putative lipoprotein (rSAM/lipoprotein system)
MGAVSFLFGSCPWPDRYGPGPAPPEYGMPPREVISGTVTYDEKPVPGFWVSILTESSYNPYTFTKENGEFEISIRKNDSGSYTVFFQDVDGPLNGEFNSKTVQWTSGDEPLNIILEPK